ncbi:MAG: aspartyl protease family protein [Armatimonadetes bacterium]|nr:aspartyl protease family protein [Armatimonadota bacterium]
MVTLLALAVVFQAPAQLVQPVEAAFALTDNAIIVDAVVNGKNASFMFDTGFTGYLTISDQFNIGEPYGTMLLTDFVGQFEAKTVMLESLQIGGLKQDGLQAHVVQLPQGRLSQSYGRHVDGIMGLAAVSDFVTEINIEKSKFIFHPKSVDITKRVPDNKRTFLVKMEPTGINHIQLVCELNGMPLMLTLDTGNSFYVVTHKEVLVRVKAWDPNEKPKYMTQAGVASGPVDFFQVWINNADIYGVPVKNSVWDVIDLPSSDVESDGTVGFMFLKNFNITIDYERRYVWLENWTGKVTDTPEAEPGIRIYPDDKNQYVVRFIYADSPADEQGIKEGDILRAVDEKSLSMVRPGDVMKLLRGPEGSDCVLVLSRNHVMKRVELKRRLMVNGRRID